MLKRFMQSIISNKTVMLLVLGSALFASVYIDARNYIILPSDMRNRIVGSRMLYDGQAPYFYIWKAGGPVRYYDTHTVPNSLVSASTATPFFHWMITPVANLMQYQINAFWFIMCWLLLGICWLLMLLAMPPPNRKKVLLLTAVAVLFTYTTGWRIHINVGQNYIFLPVMMTGCYYCLMQKKDWLHLLLFGVFTAALVLMRPIAFILFVPFLFYLKKYIPWFLNAAAVVIAYGIFVLSSPVQQKNWQAYFSSLKVHVQLHQQLIPLPPAVQFNGVPISGFEGIDIDSRGDEYWANKLRKGIENSNFYILYEELTGHKPPLQFMTVLGISFCLILLLPLWLVKNKRLPVSPEMLLLLGYMMYNAYEFFSPVNRGNYTFVQFIFPVLLLVLYIKELYIIPIAILLVGLILNITILPSIIMEHNIGQFMIEVATIYLVYRNLILEYVKEEKLRFKEQIFIA